MDRIVVRMNQLNITIFFSNWLVMGLLVYLPIMFNDYGNALKLMINILFKQNIYKAY